MTARGLLKAAMAVALLAPCAPLLAQGGRDYLPQTGWPMLPIPEIRVTQGGAPADIAAIIGDFERNCLESRFDRGRIERDGSLVYAPISLASPGGSRQTMHVWRGSNRTVQLMNVEDQGMGNQCTLTVTTSRPVDIKRVHAGMTARFGEQRNYRADQAAFRAADGRFAPDWIAYRAHWLGDGNVERPRILVFAQSFDGTGAQARSRGVHLIAAELTE